MPAMRAFRVAEDPAIRVLELGLACCALEVESAVRRGLLISETTDDAAAATDPERTVLLVSGTVTDAVAPVVSAALADVDGSAEVVAFGVCAGSGGPYWDAPSVLNGAGQLVDVQLFVPGCPPRPEALIDALVGRGVSA